MKLFENIHLKPILKDSIYQLLLFVRFLSLLASC